MLFSETLWKCGQLALVILSFSEESLFPVAELNIFDFQDAIFVLRSR